MCYHSEREDTYASKIACNGAQENADYSRNYYGKTDIVRHYGKDHKNGKGEEHEIHSASYRLENKVFRSFELHFAFREEQNGGGKHCHGEQEGPEHNSHKLKGGNIELCVDIKILRIAKGGEHTAKISRYIL